MVADRGGTRSGWALLVVLFAVGAQGEDFSVRLAELVDADDTRRLPAYRLERALTRSGGSDDLPEKRFDVFMRFEEFGSVRIGETLEAGPSSGKRWRKGMVFPSGIVNLDGVRAAWIRGSPDLLLVAWLCEPDFRGSGLQYYRVCLVLQLREGRCRVLLRRRNRITARIVRGSYCHPMTSSFFSFDAERGVLEEELKRSHQEATVERRELARPVEDPDHGLLFVRDIKETITLAYGLADGGLVPVRCSLVYHAQEQDSLAELARYYLGPLAPPALLLDVNEELANRYRDVHPRVPIHLEKALSVRIPVPAEWLAERFGHELPAQ